MQNISIFWMAEEYFVVVVHNWDSIDHSAAAYNISLFSSTDLY